MVLLSATKKITELSTTKKIVESHKETEVHEKQFKEVSLKIAKELIKQKLEVDKETLKTKELSAAATELNEYFFLGLKEKFCEQLKQMDEQNLKLGADSFSLDVSGYFSDTPRSFFMEMVDPNYVKKQIFFINLSSGNSAYRSKTVFFVIKNEKFYAFFCSTILNSEHKTILVKDKDSETSISFEIIFSKFPKKSKFARNTIIIACLGLVLVLIYFLISRKYKL